jgi:hypothetical protein
MSTWQKTGVVVALILAMIDENYCIHIRLLIVLYSRIRLGKVEEHFLGRNSVKSMQLERSGKRTGGEVMKTSIKNLKVSRMTTRECLYPFCLNFWMY